MADSHAFTCHEYSKLVVAAPATAVSWKPTSLESMATTLLLSNIRSTASQAQNLEKDFQRDGTRRPQRPLHGAGDEHFIENSLSGEFPLVWEGESSFSP